MTSLEVENHGRHTLKALINFPLALHSSCIFSGGTDPGGPEQSQRSVQVITPPARIAREIDPHSTTLVALWNLTRGNGMFEVYRWQRMKLAYAA